MIKIDEDSLIHSISYSIDGEEINDIEIREAFYAQMIGLTEE